MEMDEELKDANRIAKDDVRKASKSSVFMSNRLQRLKDLEFIVGEFRGVQARDDEKHTSCESG